jgi:hypothetical protein
MLLTNDRLLKPETTLEEDAPAPIDELVDEAQFQRSSQPRKKQLLKIKIKCTSHCHSQSLGEATSWSSTSWLFSKLPQFRSGRGCNGNDFGYAISDS